LRRAGMRLPCTVLGRGSVPAFTPSSALAVFARLCACAYARVRVLVRLFCACPADGLMCE
jgi:hypothetical protein